MASETMTIARDAVGTTIPLTPRFLHTYYRNARIGDVDAIAGSLKANGQFKPIVVNIGTHTGRPNEVLAGNHTLKAFRQLAEQMPFDARWSKILAHIVDVDDDMATRIVLADNRSFEQGDGFDAEVLVELLDQVGIEGTGYTDEDFDELAAALDKTTDGDPAGQDGEGGDSDPAPPSLPPAADPIIGATITFDDEDQQNAWFEFLRWLRDRYPDPDLTVGERLVTHLRETAGERV
jgi:hypothetical protein